MDIHVHLIIRQCHEQDGHRKFPLHEAPCIAIHDGMMEDLVSNESMIDINVKPTRCGSRDVRRGHKTLGVDVTVPGIHFMQMIFQVAF
jgi:hypothetical protein